ncbi:MAG: glycosyltransferase [Deltaproteobacteria bacterium]|nr:glycosyltransferase [Deltaproteobacteria bacterium]
MKNENTRIHVLHIVPGLYPGGMELAMSRIINSLVENGYRHSVVCLKGDAVIRKKIHDSVPIYCLHSNKSELSIIAQLRKIVLSVRPTVIHARNWSAWPDVAIARFMLRNPPPLIFSFHGLDSSGPMPLRRRIISRLLALVTTHIFTVSEASKKLLAQHVGFPKNRIDVIANGIDTEQFQPARTMSTNSSAIVIGTVGTLSPVKNQALLIRACAELSKFGININLRLAGEGSERSRLLELSESQGIADRVHLLGHIADVSGFLQQLDIFVLPSDSEAHPNALIEAMSCGLPCIGTHVGGVPEMLEWGRCGQLVQAGDLDGLIEAIRQLANDSVGRKTLGNAARKRVSAHYSLDQMVNQYAELYGWDDSGHGSDIVAPTLNTLSLRMPRVVMLGPMPPLIGGMATVVNNLHKSTLTERCKLTVLNNGKTTPEDRHLISGVASQLKLLAQLMTTIRRQRAQILHIHTCSGFTFWRDSMHAIIGNILGCHIVWHIHGAQFDSFAASTKPLGKKLLSFALNMGEAVIVLTQQWKENLFRYAISTNWSVVQNGVEAPAKANILNRRKSSLLFLGNLGKRKGVYNLIIATKVALDKGFRGTVSIAGSETQPGQRKRFMRIICERRCDSHIRFLGVISGETKKAILASSDCLILPSYAEGLPMAILEGMSYGLPIISTRVGGIPEVITEGVEGLLVDSGNIQDLANAMLVLDQGLELRRQMGKAARNKFEEKYSIEHMVEKIYEIYSTILIGRKS